MKIAIISTLWEPASYLSTGGTGTISGYLADELVKRGHAVTLFASGNSLTSAKLESIKDEHFIDGSYSESLEYLNIANAFQNAKKFDIIHCNTDFRSLFFAGMVKTPSLHIMQYGEIFDDERKIFEKYKDLDFIAVSLFMKKFINLNWQGVVRHGINIEKFPFQKIKQKYLLFLARMSPQKGPHIAIQVAKKLNMKLILAGKKSPTDKKYLQQEVEPFIDNEQIKYIGEANFEQKIELLKNALCLLHPVIFNEAFGLTLIESMACGTPVIAFDKGAIPEIISHGQTGFVVNSIKEMASCVKKIKNIRPENCRKIVEQKFTVEQMANGYEKIYAKLITNK